MLKSWSLELLQLFEDYTRIVGNVVILANMQSLILLIGIIFVDDTVKGIGTIGDIIAFSGAVPCTKDANDSDLEGGSNIILCDLFAIMAVVRGHVGAILCLPKLFALILTSFCICF